MYGIQVRKNIKKDAWNWWDACNRISYGVNWKERVDKKIYSRISGKTEKEAYAFLLPYLEKLYKRIHLDKEIKLTQQIFDEKKEKIFSIMEKVTGKKIYRKNFYCYFTTFPRGPYNLKKGSVGLPVIWGRKTFINVFVHELLHFQTIYYFKTEIVEKVSDKDFENFKEALTVILNVEFKELLTQHDRGYKIHRKLREKLLHYWSKERNFSKLIDYGVKIYHKNF